MSDWPNPALVAFLEQEFGWSLYEWEDEDIRF